MLEENFPLEVEDLEARYLALKQGMDKLKNRSWNYQLRK